jgi:hypothetical protein
VEKATGGTVFIDEAYLFKPAPRGSTANASNAVLDYLLKVAETKRETTTFILAGYKEDVLNLLAYNDGFPSRFPKEFTFNFEDYDENQIRHIFCDMLKSRGFRLQKKKQSGGVPIARVIARRIARGAGKKGFGNARTVRNVLDLSINKQTARIGSKVLHKQRVTDAEHRTLTVSDVLGDRPNLAQSPLLKELDSMIGLRHVKQAVHGLMELQLQNYDREMRGEKREEISLHRVFYGNPGTFRFDDFAAAGWFNLYLFPGTGKTTVARIYGALLKEFGFLTDGDLIQVSGSDLVGDAVGQASTKTAEILKKAVGKVLFVDGTR